MDNATSNINTTSKHRLEEGGLPLTKNWSIYKKKTGSTTGAVQYLPLLLVTRPKWRS